MATAKDRNQCLADHLVLSENDSFQGVFGFFKPLSRDIEFIEDFGISVGDGTHGFQDLIFFVC